MAEAREFTFWGTDVNGDGILDADGLNAPVIAEFPLEPGDPAKVFTRSFVYVGTDGDGGGIFDDPTDEGQIYVSDHCCPVN